MPHRQIRRLLKEWFELKEGAAPADDPRRTESCLSIPEVVAAAEEGHRRGCAPRAVVDEPRRRHVEHCAWCQAALTTASRVVAGEAAPAEKTPHEWTKAVRDGLSRWLEQRARQSGSPPAARFDENGTLHINLSGLSASGPVEVSLLWDGVKLYLARGTIAGGKLEICQPMPQLGVRSTEVPAHLLLLKMTR